MFKVVCEMDRVANEAETTIKLKNCAAFEFSPFQIDNRLRDNSKRYENSKLYAQNFLEDQEMELGSFVFKDLKLAVDTVESLENFRFISVIEESDLVRPAGAPEDYPYSSIFDTVIKLHNKQGDIVDSFLEYFFSSYISNDLEKRTPNFYVKWEIFYPLEVNEKLQENKKFKVLNKTNDYSKVYHQYDPHFLKFLFGEDILNHNKIDINQNYSKDDIQDIYQEYNNQLKEIVATQFLRLLEKDKRCVKADTKSQTTFVDITPRYLLDSFYKKNYFSKVNFQETCIEKFGERLLTLEESLDLVMQICNSGNLDLKNSVMKKPSELSNELLAVNCETIEDILSSIDDLPTLIKEFDYI